MATADTIPAWIALFLGISAFAPAMGELRMPGTWSGIMQDFERSPGMRFIAGLVALALGAILYLAVPWRSGDWLCIAVAAFGGVLTVMGILLLAAGDRFVALARRARGGASDVWAGGTAVLGAGMILVALSRLETF
ncbi:hypothetical protein [Alteriqipengyuania sp. 357]